MKKKESKTKVKNDNVVHTIKEKKPQKKLQNTKMLQNRKRNYKKCKIQKITKYKIQKA